ncbi:MAG: sensor histidine kinase [Bacilli bacterium]|nr:sensor histidine kinase [Bacilli bacterium]
MSIRLRLLLSYMAMLMVPIVLFFIATVILGIAFAGDFRSVVHDYLNPQTVNETKQQEQALQAELNKALVSDPDAFLSKPAIEQWDQRFRGVHYGLVVTHNNQIIYLSKNFPIPGKANGELLNNETPVVTDGLPQFIRDINPDGQIVFHYQDQSPGSVIILNDPTPIGIFIRNFFLLLLVTLLVILILTNGTLTFLVSRSILRPLKRLKQSIEQIKEGNLNHEVKVYSSDEIGQLCLAFDEMRVKLKESIDVQLQYEENRKELISNISHDLRTPVTAIKGYVDGIKDGVADTPEKFSKYIQTISTKANDLDRLIDELFLFSKLDLKKVPFHFEKVDLAAFLQDSLEEYQLDHRTISFSFEQSLPGPVFVRADREKLKRVVINIVENSLKVIDPELGTITVTLKQETKANGRPAVAVTIADNGPGIDPAALPFIFERFYRGDPARNTGSGGSGLGLAIAKQIIDEHGGEIWAASQPGAGTTLTFRLELVD